MTYQVTDMKDGVVEKFTYDGAEFTKKDGEASVGDYVVFSDVEDGGHEDYLNEEQPYEIVGRDGWGDLIVTDGDGDEFDIDNATYEVFTKVEAPLTRKPVVGDYVVFTAEDGKPADTTIGKRYKIIEFDGVGDPRFTDDSDFVYAPAVGLYPHEFYAGESEGDTQETEVKREAKVGDRIKIVAAEMNGNHYNNGDIGFVVEEKLTGVYVELNGNRRGVWHREYVVLEAEETLTHEGATYKRVNRRAQAGDVIVVEPGKCDYTTDGKSYKVLAGTVFTDDDGDALGVYHLSRGEGDVKVYEPIASQSVLTYRDSSGELHTVTGAELIEYKTAKGDE